jgi:SAM-dependent methyltransferase
LAGIDEWTAVAQSEDPDDVRERILTGFKSGKPFTPYVPTLALPRVRSALDFGCGLGRNFPYLWTVADHVTGFDLAPMVQRCRAEAPSGPVRLESDWDSLRRERFDLVFASLVLQHIEPPACAEYLKDFATMTPLVYVLTRLDSDFGTQVLETIDSAGLFTASECVEVEHDPSTHQLRVLGRAALEEVRRARTAGHFEVVLRS